jgi:VanZ family protein
MSLRRISLWGPPLLYMALVFGLSAQSNPLPMLTAHVWDKALHLTEYAMLSALYWRALDGEGCTVRTSTILAVLAASIYGATDEFHQLFVPMRSADVHDWLADSLGALVGVAVYGSMAVRLGRRSGA